MNTTGNEVISKLDSIVSRARRQTLGDVLRRSARRYPQKSCIECGDHIRWTYREFDEACDRLAAGLLLSGLKKGVRVAVLARNSHSFALMRFALARAGGVIVPVNFMLNPDEVAYILEHSGASALCMDAEFADVGRAAAQKAGCVEYLWGLENEEGESPAGINSINQLAYSETDLSPLDGVDIAGSDVAQIIYTSGTESKPKGALLNHDCVIW